MAIAEPYTNSETIGTTEWSLTTDTAGPDVTTVDGIYQVWIDFSAMTAADQFVVKMYEKVTSGGAQVAFYVATLIGVQATPFVTPSFILLHGWDVTVDKIAGTDRSITWSIRQVA